LIQEDEDADLTDRATGAWKSKADRKNQMQKIKSSEKTFKEKWSQVSMMNKEF
jgi:hypothetical protein